MEWDQRVSKWKELQRLELDCDTVPVHRSFTEKYGDRIYQSRRETRLQAADPLEWRPCQYCGHGYRDDTRLQRHLAAHHGPELAFRGRFGESERS